MSTIKSKVVKGAVGPAVEKVEQELVPRITKILSELADIAPGKASGNEAQDIAADLRAGISDDKAISRAIARRSTEPTAQMEDLPPVFAPDEAPGMSAERAPSIEEFAESELPIGGGDVPIDSPRKLKISKKMGTVSEGEPVISSDAAPEVPGASIRAMESPESRSQKAGNLNTIAATMAAGSPLALTGDEPAPAGIGSPPPSQRAQDKMRETNRGDEPPATPDELLAATEEGRKQAKSEMNKEAAEEIVKTVKSSLDGYVPESLRLSTLSALPGEPPREVLETPSRFQESFDKVEKEGERFATTEDGKTFTKQLEERELSILEEWAGRKKELADLYKETKERIGWAKAAEMMGHALVQLGAGLYGLRTGADMSGVKFNFNDWNKNFERALDEHRLELSGLEKETEAKKGVVESERKTYADWSRRFEAVSDRLADAHLATDRANIEAANRAMDSERDRLFRMAIANKDWENEELRAEWDAKRREREKTEGRMDRYQETLATAAFKEDYDDATADLNAYSTGINKLKQASTSDNPKEAERLRREGLAEVARGLTDPQKAAQLQQAATSHSFTLPLIGKVGEEMDVNAFIEAVQKEPVKRLPDMENYMPGGAKWPTIKKGAAVMEGKPDAPATPAPSSAAAAPAAAPAQAPADEGTVTVRHKPTGATAVIKKSALSKYSGPDYEQVESK